MKKSFVKKMLIIIILILAFAVIHDVILSMSIKLEKMYDNQETDIVEKEVVTNVKADSEETSGVESSQIKVISSWAQCQEKLTCYLDEGEYSIGEVKYGTPVVKTADNIPLPYPTEEEVFNQNTLVKNLDLKIIITNDNKFIIKGNNLSQEIQLTYDIYEVNYIKSVTQALLNYQDKNMYSKYDMDIDILFTGQIMYNSNSYTIEIMKIDNKPYISIIDGTLNYISPLIKL